MRGRKAVAIAALTVAALVALMGILAAANGQDDEKTREWRKAVVVPMTGELERPNQVDTNASGLAVFWIEDDMEEICYMIYVSNMTNVSQGHIHAVEGDNTTGPPVVWLYPENSTEPEVMSGELDGVLVTGSFSAEDFVGPMEGKSMTDLLDQIETQKVYVNFHTTQYPEGEIRGEFNVLNQSCDSIEGTLRSAMNDDASAPAPQTSPGY